MSIGTIGGSSALNQLYASQQAQAVQAVSLDAQSMVGTPDSTSGDASSNALTGVSTSTLDSQTLQALMDLTQQDPSSSDPSGTSSTGQPGQSQGAHHHHHHHGGGGAMQAPGTDPSTASSTSSASTASATDAFGVAVDGADSADGSLEDALTLA